MSSEHPAAPARGWAKRELDRVESETKEPVAALLPRRRLECMVCGMRRAAAGWWHADADDPILYPVCKGCGGDERV